MKEYENRYGIYVSAVTYREFEKARECLGLSAETYLKNLMGKDFTVMVKFKKVDLKQSRLYPEGVLKPDKVE